jgi:hypothetical protein
LKKEKMKRYSTKHVFLRIVASFVIVSLFGNWQLNDYAAAQDIGNDILYTTDADFDQGTLVSVNHDAPDNNQLQLDSLTKPFPFINVAASGRGTVVRSNTETGEIVGEYRTAPEGRGLSPSRTTVDLFGNVWTANRDESDLIDGVPHGSAVKIGLIVGGTRVDGTGAPDPDGGYLAPPYGYNTCVDRNGDGLIRTSTGLGDILGWPDLTDGLGGTDGLVQDAVDECILIYQRLPDAEGARHVSVDADNNVWGGYPYRRMFQFDGTSGAISTHSTRARLAAVAMADSSMGMASCGPSAARCCATIRLPDRDFVSGNMGTVLALTPTATSGCRCGMEASSRSPRTEPLFPGSQSQPIHHR